MNTELIRAVGRPRRIAPAALVLTALQAQAAGGHHAVDDASLLEPGECQLETWADRTAGGTRSTMHLGPACRLGAVELGLNLDRTRGAGAASTAGLQLKWATPVSDTLSLGAVVSASWPARLTSAPRRTGVLLATWEPAQAWRVHANAGRDFQPGAPSSTHAGAALEWQTTPAVSFVAERFREGGGDHGRVGARWALSTAISVDLSRAAGWRGRAPAWWTVGLTWAGPR
jgi:hypothetical protein